MDNVAHNLMLDPSFLLAEDPERPLAQKISQVETLADGSGFEVYVPEGLVRFLEEQLPQYDQDEESDQFMDFYVPNLERVDLSELRSRLYGSQRIRPFDPEVFPAYDGTTIAT